MSDSDDGVSHDVTALVIDLCQSLTSRKPEVSQPCRKPLKGSQRTDLDDTYQWVISHRNTTAEQSHYSLYLNGELKYFSCLVGEFVHEHGFNSIGFSLFPTKVLFSSFFHSITLSMSYMRYQCLFRSNFSCHASLLYVIILLTMVL